VGVKVGVKVAVGDRVAVGEEAGVGLGIGDILFGEHPDKIITPAIARTFHLFAPGIPAVKGTEGSDERACEILARNLISL
jgi:hypothetical protein